MRSPTKASPNPSKGGAFEKPDCLNRIDSVEERNMRKRYLKYYNEFSISEGCAKVASSLGGGREEAADG